jgi:hypothetical protein
MTATAASTTAPPTAAAREAPLFTKHDSAGQRRLDVHSDKKLLGSAPQSLKQLNLFVQHRQYARVAACRSAHSGPRYSRSNGVLQAELLLRRLKQAGRQVGRPHTVAVAEVFGDTMKGWFSHAKKSALQRSVSTSEQIMATAAASHWNAQDSNTAATSAPTRIGNLAKVRWRE